MSLKARLARLLKRQEQEQARLPVSDAQADASLEAKVIRLCEKTGLDQLTVIRRLRQEIDIRMGLQPRQESSP